MTSIEERDKHVREILEDLYKKAHSEEIIVDESAFGKSLDELFTTTTWGFREILLVVIIGMKLDPSYKASTGLYACKPRAIYEGPIKKFLLEKGIPHRKSGPLNIAKATVGLDMNWAAQRKPRDVAEEVIKLIDFLENEEEKREDRTDAVGVALLRRLIKQSTSLQALSVDIDPSQDPEYICKLCCELIINAPDAGNTPQKIAAYLLKNYHSSLQTGVTVTGEDDRASVTSTTSKKPGDINEEKPAGTVKKVYEVTVKAFNLARIRDSYDCLFIYNSNNIEKVNEVIVICRKEDCPQNMKKSGFQGYLGSYAYQDIQYYFWDIFEWVASVLQRMTTKGRSDFYLELNEYIDDINTSAKVKKLWKKLHETE